MARIEKPAPDDLDASTRELLDQVADIHGFVPNQHRLEAHFPLLLRSLLDLNRRVIVAGDIDPTLLETIALVLAVENGCGYCEDYHTRVLADEGVDDEAIEQLKRDWREWDFSAREAVAVEFAVAVNEDPHAMTAGDVGAVLDAGYDRQDLVQLLHFVNLMRGYNTFNVVLDTEPDRAEGGWTQ